jgi:formate-dependent nitrite reductase membrane component NrfD
MENQFNTELRAQQEWSWLLAADLFFSGCGGGLFLLYELFELPRMMAIVSVALVMLGAAVLLMELGHPLRAWRAILRPRTSWISRGVLLVMVFVITAGIHIALRITAGAGEAAHSLSRTILATVAGLSALGVMLYPGFVLSASRSIPFWDTLMLPAMFFLHAAAGACGVVLGWSAFRPIESAAPVQSLAIELILVNAAILAGYLTSVRRTGPAARESVRRLVQSRLRWLFWIGVIGIGAAAPLALLLRVQPAGAADGAAGALLLLGGLLFRYSILKAGVYLPLPLAGVDLTKLNRTPDCLAVEYTGWAARRS